MQQLLDQFDSIEDVLAGQASVIQRSADFIARHSLWTDSLDPSASYARDMDPALMGRIEGFLDEITQHSEFIDGIQVSSTSPLQYFWGAFKTEVINLPRFMTPAPVVSVLFNTWTEVLIEEDVFV